MVEWKICAHSSWLNRSTRRSSCVIVRQFLGVLRQCQVPWWRVQVRRHLHAQGNRCAVSTSPCDGAAVALQAAVRQLLPI